MVHGMRADVAPVRRTSIGSLGPAIDANIREFGPLQALEALFLALHRTESSLSLSLSRKARLKRVVLGVKRAGSACAFVRAEKSEFSDAQSNSWQLALHI